MTLTKAELADMLFEKVGLNKREAKDMVETFFEEIRLALENGESVKLSGFGNFQLRDKPQQCPAQHDQAQRRIEHHHTEGHKRRRGQRRPVEGCQCRDGEHRQHQDNGTQMHGRLR